MAKRKRLSPAILTTDTSVMAPEKKLTRAPIAYVAGDAAASSALMELSVQISAARQEGRWIEKIPINAINSDYLVRDRVTTNIDEMMALKDSLRASGQQTAIEVVLYGSETFGLISGWRRLTALRELHLEGGTDTILAIVRNPDNASASYLAMVEENEIRSGLSFYERGRIVAKATDAGVYTSDKTALAALFHASPRAKRSKIGSFVRIMRALDDVLLFPTMLSERNGLALAQALIGDVGFTVKLRKELKVANPQSKEAEQTVITATIKGAKMSSENPLTVSLPSGLKYVSHTNGKITLQGNILNDADFKKRLMQALKKL